MTPGPYHDRLGSGAHFPTEPILLGQWTRPDGGGKHLPLLAPPGGGVWRGKVDGQTSAVRAPAEYDILIASETQSVGVLAQAIMDTAALYREATSWEDVLERAPLDPKLRNRSALDDLERDLADPDGPFIHLSQVCVEPRDQVGQQVERVPVYRARRIPPRAYAHLAAHSEDWATATPTSVRPRRVLTVLPDDSLDLYENRVAVRLHSHLERKITRRLDEIEAADKALGGAKSSLPPEATHHTFARVGQLHEKAPADWAAPVSTDGGTSENTVRSARDTLRSLLGQLRRLRLTPLIAQPRSRGGVDHLAHVPTDLAATNLFTQHEHYRPVGALWKRVRADSRGLSPERATRLQGDLANDYDVVCLAALSHALVNLGFDPEEPLDDLDTASGVPFVGKRGTISLRRRPDGAATLHAENALPLQVVPLPVRIAPKRPPQLLASVSELTVVMVPDAPDKSLHPLRSSSGTPQPPHVVRVSPVDLLGVEALAQAVQVWYTTSLAASYPLPLPGSHDAKWTAPDGHASAGIRPPTEAEASTWADEADRRARTRGQSGIARADRDKLNRAVRTLQALAICPVCVKEDTDFEVRPPAAFWVRCRCGSEWGLQIDSQGRHTAAIRPSGTTPPKPDPVSPDALRCLGRDAFPPPPFP